ncbi:uncharacterized protein LOC119474569 [Sebastes umbrosus]|uniref:uncharacterized protein LOC119474569 n=1 Tax=Sebastes umbrosus TaxID=72105 RepID=UPI00189CDCA1|nr:uncharacterized protein LOC119474569 [Sebastes umbrosus]XP_037602579.1 uncharacterized protein LOC119474569 [Sebastes umbrosus]XP_037602580.1 uncharacterized protein LOC119474569 [Sebastes umbrosus]XP_037602581.1 uncharacterized protein LOC119474569 [Sebastes umbrosus]XP_037602582.1 uncharacterized protein LOC119474569 [Sebastes umbrosus]XP_037602583.1 uncharacterized protein LOC119474569 [Sebastes umbrosus]XP_037602584.1 uncharacterized protein LOC119474569 [Sebastes umbrosus]XP_03760258
MEPPAPPTPLPVSPHTPPSLPSLVSSKLLQSAQALIGLGQDRLGSRDGGTEVEGEAIYPRRIRRCVTEVWTVAAVLTWTRPVVPKLGVDELNLRGCESSRGEAADWEQEGDLAARCWKAMHSSRSLSLSISPFPSWLSPLTPPSTSLSPCIILHLLQITHQLQRPSTNSVTMMPTDGNFLWSCPVIGGETSKQRTAGLAVNGKENYTLSTPEGAISNQMDHKTLCDPPRYHTTVTHN